MRAGGSWELRVGAAAQASCPLAAPQVTLEGTQGKGPGSGSFTSEGALSHRPAVSPQLCPEVPVWGLLEGLRNSAFIPSPLHPESEELDGSLAGVR